MAFRGSDMFKLFHRCPGKSEVERRTLPRSRLDPDPSPVSLHDLLTDRQPDAGPGGLGSAMEALENLEDPVGVLHGDSNSVVPH